MTRDPLYGKEIYKSIERITLSKADTETTKDLFEIVGKSKKLFKEEMYKLQRVDTGEIIEYPVSKMESEKSGYIKTVVTAELSVEVAGRDLKLRLNDYEIEFNDLSFSKCKEYLNIPVGYECLKHKSDIFVRGRKPINYIYCLERVLSTINFLVVENDSEEDTVVEISILFASDKNDIIIPELNFENGKKGLINLFGYRYDEVRNKNETTLKWKFDNVDIAAVLDGDTLIKLSFIEHGLLR